MARVSARRRPERERVLVPVRQDCPGCGGHLRLRYENRRHLVTLSGAVRLRLRIRWCEREGCPRFHVPYRPEAECSASTFLSGTDNQDGRCWPVRLAVQVVMSSLLSVSLSASTSC
jgi:hypothetical protein